jgi:carboxymethylenebutenolidase
MAATLSNAKVAGDVGSLIDYIENERLAPAGRVGIVGYCMSGAFAVAAAAAHADRVACAASYFGTRMVTEAADSPHRVAPRAKGELYFAFAESDPYVPSETVEQLRAHLAEQKKPGRIEVYPGTTHGFVFTDRGNYQEEGAARHWATLRDLLARNMG